MVSHDRDIKPAVLRLLPLRIGRQREIWIGKAAHGDPAKSRVAIAFPIQIAAAIGAEVKADPVAAIAVTLVNVSRPQASRGPSDRSRPNGRRCRFGAGKPCSGTDQPTGARPRRSPGAIRNGILPFSPEASKPLIISRGTGCSNPFPSSGESREL